MVLIRSTRNLTSDRLKKDIKKNTLIMGETAEVSEETAAWLKKKGYAEDVTDQTSADQDGANNPVLKPVKGAAAVKSDFSLDADAVDEADEKAAKARKAAAAARKS